MAKWVRETRGEEQKKVLEELKSVNDLVSSDLLIQARTLSFDNAKFARARPAARFSPAKIIDIIPKRPPDQILYLAMIRN